MPPISCTSKWRILSTRLPPRAPTAKASGSTASSDSPPATRWRSASVLPRSSASRQRLELRLEGVDLFDRAPVLLEQALVAAAEDRGE
jgi:hypothetical protein